MKEASNPLASSAKEPAMLIILLMANGIALLAHISGELDKITDLNIDGASRPIFISNDEMFAGCSVEIACTYSAQRNSLQRTSLRWIYQVKGMGHMIEQRCISNAEPTCHLINLKRCTGTQIPATNSKGTFNRRFRHKQETGKQICQCLLRVRPILCTCDIHKFIYKNITMPKNVMSQLMRTGKSLPPGRAQRRDDNSGTFVFAIHSLQTRSSYE